MRYYPTDDISHYCENPSSWTFYCKDPHKSWYRQPQEGKHVIRHWRDIEGGKMPTIMQKDLYFKDWPRSRIRPEACLPMYYCVGNRFIALEKVFPVGFKCATSPVSLKDVQGLKQYEKEFAKYKKAAAAEAKKMSEDNKKKRIR